MQRYITGNDPEKIEEGFTGWDIITTLQFNYYR